MLQGIRDDVRGGKALSQALDARREVFSRFYVNIVRAGEAGGALGTVLQRLAGHDGAQQGAARIGALGADLSDDPDRSSRWRR